MLKICSLVRRAPCRLKRYYCDWVAICVCLRLYMSRHTLLTSFPERLSRPLCNCLVKMSIMHTHIFTNEHTELPASSLIYIVAATSFSLSNCWASLPKVRNHATEKFWRLSVKIRIVQTRWPCGSQHSPFGLQHLQKYTFVVHASDFYHFCKCWFPLTVREIGGGGGG